MTPISAEPAARPVLWKLHLCTSNELRGYTAGKYFTRYTLATQLEYRLVLPKRFGLVVFGGLGGTIPGGSQLLQRVQSGHFLLREAGDCD